MSDNEDENIILPCNSNNMTLEEYYVSSTNGFEDGNDVQNVDRNASENDYAQDTVTCR